MDASEPDSTYYNDLIGTNLYVPCSSWDCGTAVKCWGQNFATLNVRGFIEKVSIQRKTGQPRFQVKFPEKKYEKVFFVDLDYILTYSEEVPLKYHLLKADSVKKTINAAQKAIQEESVKSMNTKALFIDDVMKESKSGLEKDSSKNESNEDTESDVDINQKPMKGKKKACSQSVKGVQATVQKKAKSNKVTEIVSDSSADEYSDVDEESKKAGLWQENDEVSDGLFEPGSSVFDIDDKGPKPFDQNMWSYGELPTKVDMNFTAKPGPQHTLSPENAMPWEYFCLYIPIFFWSKWALYTNLKAEQEMGKSKEKTPRYWSPTGAAELKAWVGSVIWWCLGVSQTFHTFWNEDYDRNKMKSWFSEFRWYQIRRYFKISNPQEDEQNKGDKIQKVRELWESFIFACKRWYWPSQQVGVDEAIKRFKGRCSFKQYIKSKPCRWGLKAFCLCCSATGYLWNAFIYCGKNDVDDSQNKELGATHALVLNLLEPLAGKHHIVHMDNYFTSIPLFNDLASQGTWCCGTMRSNRRGVCPAVVMKKTEEAALKKNPGTIRYASYGSLCLLSWFAKRAVLVLTNCYSPQIADETDSILHWFTEDGSKVQRNIPRPPAIKYYNHYMGAVDLYDQYRSYVQMDVRTRKFWHVLFWLVIESALINSWILYKATRENAHLAVKYTFFTFRKSIALALVAEWEKMGCRQATPCELSPQQILKVKSHVRTHLHSANRREQTRFSSADKHYSHMAKIPCAPDAKWKRQLKCIQCKVSKTIWMCTECGAIPLCKDTCFFIYHTKPEQQVEK
jgi:hypothetical protein